MDELLQYNISHVTITINCIDPDIGARIYPWIIWNQRRLHSRKAAEILIEQQQQGLAMLVAQGVLVKINSILIPGINDEHLQEVNRVVKQQGAFLHNIMPLLARPEHGTYYRLMGQREPTSQELQTLQDACGSGLRMMRHCRQCRSDAVGLLGQNRSAEFSLDKVQQRPIDHQAAMARRAQVHATINRQLATRRARTGDKPAPQALYRCHSPAARPVLMAVTSQGSGLINEHFGRAREFLIYEVSPAGVRLLGHRKADRYCTGPEDCGEVESRLTDILRALEGCEVLLCAQIGIEPWNQLEAAGIQPNSEHALEPIEEAVLAVYQKLQAAVKLTPVAVCSRQAGA